MTRVSGSTFINELVQQGITRFSGVPCSSFKGLFSAPELEYMPAPHEGLAYAWAVGSHLAGRPTGVITQNSGVGNLMNALTSLAIPCGVPVFSLVSLRGWPTPESDEAQHAVMGQATKNILRKTGAMVQIMDAEHYQNQLRQLLHADAKVPRFLLVPKDLLVWKDTAPSNYEGNEHHELSAREVVQIIAEFRHSDMPIFSTTGYTSRYLASFGDLPTNFYMQGSMGHAPALAAGYAAASGRNVIILDGDGALAMHPGSMSLIGGSSLHVVHVVISNGMYASTGGQTLPMTPDWKQLAHAYKYDFYLDVDTASDLAQACISTSTITGSSLIVAHTNNQVINKLPRASTLIKMNDMFMRFLAR